jgi:hypothetical protein
MYLSLVCICWIDLDILKYARCKYIKQTRKVRSARKTSCLENIKKGIPNILSTWAKISELTHLQQGKNKTL